MRAAGLIVIDLVMVVGGLFAAFFGLLFLMLASGPGDLGPGPGWYTPVGLLGLLGGLGISVLGVFRLVRRPARTAEKAAPTGDPPPYWPPPPDWSPQIDHEAGADVGR
jgi:hypothetical protein